jgi:serine O-acetyltransferase
VLGPVTIGAGARVGANAVVLKNVPEHCTAVGVPARILRPDQCDSADKFLPYGTPLEDLPDPVARVVSGLIDEVAALRRRIDELETEAAPGAAIGASEIEPQEQSATARRHEC